MVVVGLTSIALCLYGLGTINPGLSDAMWQPLDRMKAYFQVCGYMLNDTPQTQTVLTGFDSKCEASVTARYRHVQPVLVRHALHGRQYPRQHLVRRFWWTYIQRHGLVSRPQSVLDSLYASNGVLSNTDTLLGQLTALKAQLEAYQAGSGAQVDNAKSSISGIRSTGAHALALSRHWD